MNKDLDIKSWLERRIQIVSQNEQHTFSLKGYIVFQPLHAHFDDLDWTINVRNKKRILQPLWIIWAPFSITPIVAIVLNIFEKQIIHTHLARLGRKLILSINLLIKFTDYVPKMT